MKAKLLGRVMQMKRGATADFCEIVLDMTGSVEGSERTGKAAKMACVLQVSPQYANNLKFGTELVVHLELKEDTKLEVPVSLPAIQATAGV